MNKSLAYWFMRVIEQEAGNHFYGEIAVTLVDGQIKLVRVNKTLKPDMLSEE